MVLAPAAQLNCLDRPPPLGPLLPLKYQYDAAKQAQKEQALANWIRLVSKWHPLCWVSATVMNFLVQDPLSYFLNAFKSSLMDVDWVEAWVTRGVSHCLDGALLWELAKEYAVDMECMALPTPPIPSPPPPPPLQSKTPPGMTRSKSDPNTFICKAPYTSNPTPGVPSVTYDEAMQEALLNRLPPPPR